MPSPLIVSGPFETQLAHLITVAWIVLIPVGVLLALLLYKLFILLNAVLEFVTIARYDVVPMLKEMRETLVHVEAVSARVSVATEKMEQVAGQTRPFLQKSGRQLQEGLGRLAYSGQVLFDGVRKAFVK